MIWLGARRRRATGARAGVIALLLVSAALVLGDPRPAWAYIDPGAGSYITQLIVAALVTVSFLARLLFGRVKGFLARVFSRKDGGQ